jgi:hypothetical protein
MDRNAVFPRSNRLGAAARINFSPNGNQVVIAAGGKQAAPPRQKRTEGRERSVASEASGSVTSTAMRPAFPQDGGGSGPSASNKVTSKPRS